MTRRKPIPNHFTQIVRTNPQTGAIERPWRQRDGHFVLADPAHGAQRHHKENAITVPTYSEAVELVRRGHPVRMSDGGSAASLVSPASLELIDAPVERIDDLWNYTMPEAPFSLQDMLSDLRRHIQSQASDIGWTANSDAASAFIGFPFDPTDDSDDAQVLDRIDLDRFNITRIARSAYVSAFRPWSGPAISEDDADELEQIIGGATTRYGRRHPSPLDREVSPLFRTLMAAYFRWQIVDGCFLSDERLDQNAMVAIGALTGMPAPAVRNALSREGISTVKSKLDYAALIEWIVNRRNFAPLREEEQPKARLTWRCIHEMHTYPMGEAFSNIRKITGAANDDVTMAEQAIDAAVARGQSPGDTNLRRYATAIGAQPDSFILALREHWAAN